MDTYEWNLASSTHDLLGLALDAHDKRHRETAKQHITDAIAELDTLLEEGASPAEKPRGEGCHCFILAFASKLAERYDEHRSDKGDSWKECDIGFLYDKLKEEHTEIQDLRLPDFTDRSRHRDPVVAHPSVDFMSELVDLALVAAMCWAREQKPPAKPQRGRWMCGRCDTWQEAHQTVCYVCHTRRSAPAKESEEEGDYGCGLTNLSLCSGPECSQTEDDWSTCVHRKPLPEPQWCHQPNSDGPCAGERCHGWDPTEPNGCEYNRPPPAEHDIERLAEVAHHANMGEGGGRPHPWEDQPGIYKELMRRIARAVLEAMGGEPPAVLTRSEEEILRDPRPGKGVIVTEGYGPAEEPSYERNACPSCGTFNPEGSENCSHCLTPLEPPIDTSACPDCGRVNLGKVTCLCKSKPPADPYCQYCGERGQNCHCDIPPIGQPPVEEPDGSQCDTCDEYSDACDCVCAVEEREEPPARTDVEAICPNCGMYVSAIIGGPQDQYRTCPECEHTWDVPPAEEPIVLSDNPDDMMDCYDDPKFEETPAIPPQSDGMPYYPGKDEVCDHNWVVGPENCICSRCAERRPFNVDTPPAEDRRKEADMGIEMLWPEEGK